MTAYLVLLLGALGLLAGCSVGVGMSYDPSASGETWDQRYCDLRGGYWNRNANVCESPLSHW
jgi:hypothetical protein